MTPKQERERVAADLGSAVDALDKARSLVELLAVVLDQTAPKGLGEGVQWVLVAVEDLVADARVLVERSQERVTG